MIPFIAVKEFIIELNYKYFDLINNLRKKSKKFEELIDMFQNEIK